MQNGNISIPRGDDQIIGVNILTTSGTPYNLSGCSLIFTAMQGQSYFGPTALTEITTGHANPVSGISQISFASADTIGLGDLPYAYTIKLISAENTTTTLIYGLFQLLPTSQ